MASMTRGEMMDLLAGFAAQDPEYLKMLRKDPKGVIAKQLNLSAPDKLKVKLLEETADTMYIVVPFSPAEGEELSDDDLEAVAGGFLGGLFGGGGGGGGSSSVDYDCANISGAGTASSQSMRGNFTHVSITAGGSTR